MKQKFGRNIDKENEECRKIVNKINNNVSQKLTYSKRRFLPEPALQPITSSNIYASLQPLTPFITKTCRKYYILHKFFADRSDVLAECSAEHHDLFLVRGGAEDVLNVTSHV
jgi:hypothetical protein